MKFNRPFFGDHTNNSKKEIIGVISNHANFRYIENELLYLYKNLKGQGYDKTEISIVDKSGKIISEYDPSFEKKDDFQHNYNILNKYSILSDDPAKFSELEQEQNSSFIAENKRKKIKQLVGYARFSGPKWIDSVGWTAIIRSNEKDVYEQFHNIKLNFMFVILVISSIALVISYLIAVKISTNFITITSLLKNAAEKTQETGSVLANASQEATKASVNQASAVQETVSAMSEISSMISQTVDHVKECSVFADTVSEKTVQGSLIMEQLTTSMDSIQEANAGLQNMANIIHEVTNKTAIINDIVFKTQLLSINASIEAARAGQHGKGFSVVAEEVGNLAQTSGSAAKEIQTLLLDSHKQVSKIIQDTTSKISEGQKVTQNATKEFNTILKEIENINERLKSISLATNEEKIGVDHVILAMSQMDSSTKHNNELAMKTYELSQEINQQGSLVRKIMRAIQVLVLGNNSYFQRQDKQSLIDTLASSWDEDSNLGNRESSHEIKNERVSQKNKIDVSVLKKMTERLKRKNVQSSSKINESKSKDVMDADDPSFKK